MAPAVTAVVAGILGVLGALGGRRATQWLRAGSHRYPEDSGPLPRATWLPAVCAVAASASVLLFGDRGLGDHPAYGIGLALLVTPLVVLAAIDADVHRLPDRLTYPLAGPP